MASSAPAQVIPSRPRPRELWKTYDAARRLGEFLEIIAWEGDRVRIRELRERLARAAVAAEPFAEEPMS